jgi:hypothetical protein
VKLISYSHKLKRECSLPNASQSAIIASHAIPLQDSCDESIPRPRIIVMPLNPHNRRLRITRMRAQTRVIRNIPLILRNIRSLQLPENLRTVPPVRAIAMVLISRSPILVSLLPLLRDVGLDRVVLTQALHGLGFTLGGGASRLQLREAQEAVIVLVAEVEGAAAVAASLADLVGRAASLFEKLAAAFVEIDDSGAGVLAGLGEAALDSTIPVWVFFTHGKPVLDVVADAHFDGLIKGFRG